MTCFARLYESTKVFFIFGNSCSICHFGLLNVILSLLRSKKSRRKAWEKIFLEQSSISVHQLHHILRVLNIYSFTSFEMNQKINHIDIYHCWTYSYHDTLDCRWFHYSSSNLTYCVHCVVFYNLVMKCPNSQTQQQLNKTSKHVFCRLTLFSISNNSNI